MKILLLPLAALLLSACPPPPEVPVEPTTDAGDEPACETVACACDRLCDLGCGECAPECVASVEHILESRISHFDVPCVARATSKEQARACPMIKCP